MFDLISHGIDWGVINGRRIVEIPSASFVALTEQTKLKFPQPSYPYPPD